MRSPGLSVCSRTRTRSFSNTTSVLSGQAEGWHTTPSERGQRWSAGCVPRAPRSGRTKGTATRAACLSKRLRTKTFFVSWPDSCQSAAVTRNCSASKSSPPRALMPLAAHASRTARWLSSCAAASDGLKTVNETLKPCFVGSGLASLVAGLLSSACASRRATSSRSSRSQAVRASARTSAENRLRRPPRRGAPGRRSPSMRRRCRRELPDPGKARPMASVVPRLKRHEAHEASRQLRPV